MKPRSERFARHCRAHRAHESASYELSEAVGAVARAVAFMRDLERRGGACLRALAAQELAQAQAAHAAAVVKCLDLAEELGRAYDALHGRRAARRPGFQALKLRLQYHFLSDLHYQQNPVGLGKPAYAGV